MLSWGQFPSLWGLCRRAEEAHTAPLCRVTQVCVCVKPFPSIALCFSPLSLHRGPQEPEARREQPPGLSLGGSCLKRGCNLGLPVPELLAFLPPSQGKTMQALPYPTSAPYLSRLGGARSTPAFQTATRVRWCCVRRALTLLVPPRLDSQALKFHPVHTFKHFG